MTSATRTGKPLLALLLTLSTLAFGVGVLLERSGEVPRVEASVSQAETIHLEGEHRETLSEKSHEALEGEETHAGEKHPEGTAGEPEETHTEGLILGINPESPWAVGGAVLASLALAMLVWRMKATWLTVTVVLFGTAFAVLDFREVLHQLQNPSVILLFAGLAFVLHLAVAMVACGPVPWRRRLR